MNPSTLESWRQEAEQLKASIEITAQAMDGANPCDFPEWNYATRMLTLLDLLNQSREHTKAVQNGW